MKNKKMGWKLQMEKMDNRMKGCFRNNGITLLKMFLIRALKTFLTS